MLTTQAEPLMLVLFQSEPADIETRTYSVQFSFLLRTHPHSLRQETPGRLRGPLASIIVHQEPWGTCIDKKRIKRAIKSQRLKQSCSGQTQNKNKKWIATKATSLDQRVAARPSTLLNIVNSAKLPSVSVLFASFDGFDIGANASHPTDN